MTDFKNKTVLITGAASGIGRLMAQKVAARGGELFLWDIDQKGLDSLKAELQQDGSAVTTYICDLTDRSAIQKTSAAVLKNCGAIDILINNAGIVSGKPCLEASDAEILHTFEVNTLAHFWIIRIFLPGMIERNSGHIVTIASAAGLLGTPKLADYSSSKFAAVGMMESLRLELRRLKSGVKTTIVCPYYIDTGMFAGVKTRFPSLLPILKPEYVTHRIMKAIQKNKQRLIMPRFVMTLYPARLLPVSIFDFLVDFFGINHTMDEFKGRSG
jgi:all-trans-retinol dehydrogenase (NAD+)